MNIRYKSTRSSNEIVNASVAILRGLAPDGGLYVPTSLPKLDKSLIELGTMNYQEVAYEVMKLFLSDYTKEELEECINKAYDNKFDTKEIAPLVKSDGVFYLELFHGATIAFKDMALSILPHLLTMAAKKNKIENEIVILTATSGDTGKAALAGFAGVKGTKIIVFYPKEGVSHVQELQMVTQKGENTYVVGIDGNFDDAQSGVKSIFRNKELVSLMNEKGYQLSSANSINIGRLVPQIVYYVYAYTRLLNNHEIAKGEEINLVIPTGNFGNILAAYYAKSIGIPVHKLICASNDNKVLYDFFETGNYDRNREFILTNSPSMDILVSSNLERLIYLISKGDSEVTRTLMLDLNDKGNYNISSDMKERLNDFVGGYAKEEQTTDKIKSLYEKTGYVIDTHTAVAANVYDTYREKTLDQTKTVIASTASPYKFAQSVMGAMNEKFQGKSDFELFSVLSELSNTEIPKSIKELQNANVLHKTVCKTAQMQGYVEEILGL